MAPKRKRPSTTSAAAKKRAKPSPPDSEEPATKTKKKKKKEQKKEKEQTKKKTTTKKIPTNPKPVAGIRKHPPGTAPPQQPALPRKPIPGFTLAGNPRKRRPKRRITFNKPSLPERRWRRTTVYDAVEGRVNYEGFIKKPFLNEFGEIRVRSQKPRSADEVLARRMRAPKAGWRRYEWPSGIEPVESDLAFGLYRFALYYYRMTGKEDESVKSFSGPALVALSMLLEEAINSHLGETGHLAIVDPEVVETDSDSDATTKGRRP